VSRLESAIRRLEAQRACLDAAIDHIRDRPGIILELGLGNGRTYDHLRERLPGREIFVFERHVAAHPDCVPDAAHLLLGDFRDTLRVAARRFAGQAVLVHADIGTGDPAASAALAKAIQPLLIPLMAPGGLIASDQRFTDAGWRPLALPAGVDAGRYFLYEAAAS
jgi:S-adenosyl-L-methionine methyltransferase